MFKFGKTLAVSTLTASIFSISSLAAGNNIPESYKFIPKESLMTFDMKNSDTAWEVVKKNNSLNKINFFAQLGKDAKDGSLISALFEDSNRKNFGENFVLSLLDFNFANSKDSMPNLIIVEEMKNNESVTMFKNRITQMTKNTKEFKREDSKFKDAEIVSFKSLKKDKDEMDNYHFGLINNFILASNKKENIIKSLESFYGQDLSVASLSDFAKSYEKLGSDFQIQFHLNNKKFFSAMYDSKEMKKAMKDMNFNYEDLMASNLSLFNFRMNAKSVDINSYSTLDKNNKIGRMALESKASNFKKYIRMSPKNTLFFISGADLKNAGQILSDMLPKTKDLDYAKIFKDAIGVDLIDTIKNLEDDFALAVFSNESSPIPGFAIMATPKDRNKMVETLNSIKFQPDAKGKGKRSEKASKPQLPIEFKFAKKSLYRDVDIFTANEIADLTSVNIQPSYGFINKDMILASNEAILKSIVDRNNTPVTEYNLEGNPSFSQLSKEFGEMNNSLGFINLSTIVNMVSPFMQSNKDMKDTLTELKKLDAIGFNRTNDTEGSFGKFILLADIENMDFGKILPADMKKGFNVGMNGGVDRARIASVKANMHTIQVVAETHAVDWKGLYPSSLENLEKEASSNKYGNYWKDIKNPFTQAKGIGVKGSSINYATYNALKSKPQSLKGMTVYQPQGCKTDKASKKTLCNSYKIYGLDNNGKIIQDEGINFVLING